MLKKSITYVDFNGKTVTDEFHFHISKAELVEMEASRRGGLAEHLQRIVESEDGAQIIGEFKNLIAKSIGKVSDDGKRFMKSYEITQEFMETNAYSELFMELATNADAAAEFVNGIIPEGLGEQVAEIGAVPEPPQRKREHVEGERPQQEEKVISKADAEAMDKDELLQKMKDGWGIQT
jgi:hypothetical protein